MVWGERSTKQPSLSYEAFLAIAGQEGIDLSDGDYLAQLYGDVQGLLDSMADMLAIDADPSEPADVYVAGAEAE